MEQDYWQTVAGPVWVAEQKELDALLAPYAEALMDAVRVPASETLVDVGCGCGATTLLARAQSPEATIIGLDVSKPMLDLACQRAQDTGDKRTQFVLGDAAIAALPEHSVERIISRFGVMFFSEPTAAFANMRRWLKPTGKLVAMIWGPVEDNAWIAEPVTVLAGHIHVEPPASGAPDPFSLGQAARRHAVFNDAGFTIAEERSFDAPVHVPGDVEQVLQFYVRRGAPAAALEAADEQGRAKAIDALRAHIASKHDGTGISLPAHAIRVTLTP